MLAVPIAGAVSTFLGDRMKIRLIQSVAGADFAHKAGDEVEWKPDADAKRLIEAGIAEPVAPKRKKKTETAAAKSAVETATE